MQSSRIDPFRRIAVVTAAPLLLVAAGIVHPHHLTAATAADWAGLHVLLLPVFPFLAAGLLVPLWGRPRRDLDGVLTVVAWVGSVGYAAYYTGLDAVAGIAAGTAADHGATDAVRPLFDAGNALGRAGIYALITAALAASVVLLRRHGPVTLPGIALMLGACWSFLDSHIFWPDGVLTMAVFALAFGLLAWQTAPGRTERERARRSP